MIVNSKRKWGVLAITLFIFLLIAGYWRIFFSYFQQDEWMVFGRLTYVEAQGLEGLVSYIFGPAAYHYVPLSRLVTSVLFLIFRLDYTSYAIISLALHLITSLLVFVFLGQVFKKDFFALTGALLFSVFAAGFQATSWVLVNLSTHGATIFGLLSVILLFKFLKNKNKKHFIYSLCALSISVLFKEITIGLFLLLPLILLLYSKNKISKKRKYSAAIIITLTTYILFRAGMFALSSNISDSAFADQKPANDKIVYNLFTIPLKTLSQSFLPIGQLKGIASLITHFIPEVVIENLSITTFFIFSLVLFFICYRKRKTELPKHIILGFSWIILNSFVFSFTPERSGIVTAVDSRNLYFISIGTVIIIISLAISFLAQKSIRKILFLLFPIFALNIFWLNKELIAVVDQSKVRIKIINSIKTTTPTIPDNTIFYTESDKSYYGIPDSDRIFPFQSGFGQMLLVVYYQSDPFPSDFFADRFLWEITDQGYRKIGSRGFGYFRDFNLLVSTLTEYNLPIDSVIAWRYDSEADTIENFSREIQGRLQSFFAKKKLLPKSSYSLESSVNQEDLKLLSDNNLKTFWDSGVQYMFPQSITVNLKSTIKIAQIEINSHGNKDQNSVGYRLLSSMDGENWQEVFYSKKYPPDTSGIVNLYFTPTNAKHLRLEQVGHHQYAAWVIYEINIYEATL